MNDPRCFLSALLAFFFVPKEPKKVNFEPRKAIKLPYDALCIYRTGTACPLASP
jgi:hypothetical protein